MRVCMLSWESYHSVAVGGVAAHVSDLAAVMARKGHDVHVVTRMMPGQSFHDVIDGVHYDRCPYVRHPDFVDDVNNMCRAFVDRVFILEDTLGAAFDIVHAHDWLTANAMIWIKRGRARRGVLTMHSTEYARCGNTFPNGRSQRVRDQERAGTYWADRIITVSQATKDELSWMYETPAWKSTVVYNGVDPHRFDEPVDQGALKKQYGIGPLDPTVLFCGRLEWQKGPDVLVEAMPAVLRAQPSAKFAIVGEGGMRGQMENRARQLGVGHAVRFLGRRTGDDLTNLFKMCETLCVPSRNEPFGIVVLEGWSAGKPVVVSQNGGPNEYVTHEVNGLKIFPNASSVAWGLTTLFSNFDRARWMGRNGREAVEARFTWDKIVAQTLDAYDPEGGLRQATPEPEPVSPPLMATTAPVPMTAVVEPAGRPLVAQAKVMFRVKGDVRMAAAAVSECKRLLARSGLVTHLRRRSVIIQGKWHAVMEAVRQCTEIVARSGDARIVTAIRPVGVPAVQADTFVEEPAETQAPAAISLTGPRLHSGAAKAKRHRMSVA
ncbi:MAG: glycosyltransferase [Planctomycetota bacterium]|nr:glycosyltransferase [Planctomycetota bacterium]